jgi:hypothetical protein
VAEEVNPYAGTPYYVIIQRGGSVFHTYIMRTLELGWQGYDHVLVPQVPPRRMLLWHTKQDLGVHAALWLVSAAYAEDRLHESRTLIGEDDEANLIQLMHDYKEWL